MTASLPGWGISVPQVAADGGRPVDHLAYARRAEQLGFEGLWLSDSANGAGRTLEPSVLLAHLAAVTNRPLLGVAVLISSVRTPYQIARDFATVDVVSRGRLVLGTGLGRPDPAVAAAHGLTTERRLARYVDGIELVRRLWTDDHLDFADDWWTVRGDNPLVRPLQRPHPPIWYGGGVDAALRRAAETAQGWIAAGAAPLADLPTALAAVREHLDRVGRDPASFTIAKRVYVAVDDDRARALGRLQDWFGARYGNPEMADRVAVVGGVEEVADALGNLRGHGIDHLILNPLFDEADHLEVLAGEVLPAI